MHAVLWGIRFSTSFQPPIQNILISLISMKSLSKEYKVDRSNDLLYSWLTIKKFEQPQELKRVNISYIIS